MSINTINLVDKLTKEQEKIVAAEFDKRYPDTGILSFTNHAKSQFVLRKYNQYGLVCQRYRDRITVITVLERFKTKTKDNRIIVEGIERNILWTQ